MSDWLLGSDQLIDTTDFIRMMGRLGFNLVFLFLVCALYHKKHKNRDHVFTMATLNVITFSMCVLLRKVPVDLGFALGMFAVFGILRYRTEPIRIRDLTYLFVVIGLGIYNGIANKKVSVVELAAVDVTIVALAMFLETFPRNRHHTSVPMLYDNLQLLRKDREPELIKDLAERTGLEVVRVEVLRIDMLRDAAEVVVYHVERRGALKAGRGEIDRKAA